VHIVCINILWQMTRQHAFFLRTCLCGVTVLARNVAGLLGIHLYSVTQDETVCLKVRQSVSKSDSLSQNQTVCPVVTLAMCIKRFALPVWSSQHSMSERRPLPSGCKKKKVCHYILHDRKIHESTKTGSSHQFGKWLQQAEDLANHSWQCNCNLWTFSVH